jgi:hypothetical protein
MGSRIRTAVENRGRGIEVESAEVGTNLLGSWLFGEDIKYWAAGPKKWMSGNCQTGRHA